MDFSFLFSNFFELSITGLVLGSVYALVALGYTLVYGVLQLINFAHADVFMWGTFVVAWVFILTGASGSTTLLGAAPYLLIALVAAASASGGLAMLVERIAYRRLVRKRALSYIILISAIGASFVLSETMGIRDKVVALIDGIINAVVGLFGGHIDIVGWLSDYTSRARGVTTLPLTIKPQVVFSAGNFSVRDTDLTIILAALIMMIGLDQFIRRTRLGREIRAVAQDPEAAALMGSNSTSVVSKTFLIGGIMAGVAAVLYQIKVGATTFDLGVVLGIKAFTAAVLGGIGNLRGALLGGLLLGVVENYGSALFGTQWKDVVAFLLLVLILLVRPTGLLGQTLGRARA
ncbi:branched-chain amino acid ABC transporter permease [Galbitalea sp. SE-J8]|uniref:branched-chain amino acid ABC transporter permease n=1 Tax=Galbitalea sp. SE-J8 TaxID=3054952 RepID=UPI00259CCF84|nr:branched-chain amino acid ABC transporter permease [Galbitalea sp. SE-J8]MDM4761439.1 branched-chain amino acid ABC transporter permease [Galbitalea sp. SE-J8]